MIFDDNIIKSIVASSTTASNNLDLETIIKESDSNYGFVDYINSHDSLIENFKKSLVNPLAEALEKNSATFNEYLNQLNYNTEKFLNCITTQVLPAINICEFNNYMQNIYDKTPIDTEINLNETELNIVKNILSCIESYNVSCDIATKIKIPVNKEKIYSIFLFITIIIMLVYSGYNITEHIYSICEGILASIAYDNLTKKDSQ